MTMSCQFLSALISYSVILQIVSKDVLGDFKSLATCPSPALTLQTNCLSLEYGEFHVDATRQ